MKKSIIQLVDALKGKLLEFPGIVTKLERKEVDFLKTLLAWIIKSEEILSTYNLSSVSELAGIRGKIISARFSDNRGSSEKKLQLKIASESLFDVQKVVLDTLKPFELKVEECRELVRQLLLIIAQTKTIKYSSDLPFEVLVNDIWQFILSNEQLKAGAIKLKTSLTLADIQVLIAEEINIEDF
ncbi:MAG: hypothetical protein F9K37_13205 [Bacteroidales bacterium]|nr:MAG: hypothetical protein F9K37_13205 [Bacteroidales bacterium]